MRRKDSDNVDKRSLIMLGVRAALEKCRDHHLTKDYDVASWIAQNILDEPGLRVQLTVEGRAKADQIMRARIAQNQIDRAKRGAP